MSGCRECHGRCAKGGRGCLRGRDVDLIVLDELGPSGGEGEADTAEAIVRDLMLGVITGSEAVRRIKELTARSRA